VGWKNISPYKNWNAEKRLDVLIFTNMKALREAIRSMIQDDALYKRKDLPGDVDEPESESDCGCDCDCDTCSGDSEDYVTPKYALYSMIGDAINLYDSMENDELEDDEMNEMILDMADAIRNMKV
jgi:hypothetical protein